jgi:hypothetical protein
MKYLPNGYEPKEEIREFIARRLAEARKLFDTASLEKNQEEE